MNRIAFVATNDYPAFGGSEHLWFQALLRMHEKGYEVGASVNHMVASCDQIQQIRDLNRPVFVRSISPILERLHIDRIRPRMREDSNGAWMDRFRPDFVVISQGASYDGWWCARQCRNKGIPYVLIVQAVVDSHWPLDQQLDELVGMYGEAAGVFFLSPNNKKTVEKQLGMEILRSVWMQNPYNVSYEAAPGWPNESIANLACVARLEPPSKGQDVLFEVLNQGKWRSRPLAVRLFGMGRQSEALRRLARLWRLDNVDFCGFVDNIETVWADHHALVLPSRSEGLPLAVVEAMLCSRFCIVTDVAGNADLIEDNINGFVAAAPQPELLDDAMERAWNRRDEWEKIGRVAGETVRNTISSDPIGNFVKDLSTLLCP